MVSYIPRIKFYNLIHLPVQSSTSAPSDDGEGLLRMYKVGTTFGTLSLRTKTGQSTYGWKNMIHTITSADTTKIDVDVDSNDPGKVTLTCKVNGGGDTYVTNILDSSAAVCVVATIDSSANLDSSGKCYINPMPIIADPTYRYLKVDVYNAAYQPVYPVIGVAKQGRVITLDFGSKANYVTGCGTTGETYMTVHVLVGKAYSTNVLTTMPNLIDLVDKDEAFVADASLYNEMKGSGYNDYDDHKEVKPAPASERT